MKRRSLLASVCVASVMVMGALWPWARIPGIVANIHARHHGCDNASLQGSYGFVRTGINQVLGGPVAIVGLTTFNGDGTLSGERETASRNGEIQDWTDLPPTGTYVVDLDCTGSIFAQDGTKGGSIVVVDGGNEFSSSARRREGSSRPSGKELM